MKRKTYLAIIWIITALVIIFGSIYHVRNFVMGVRDAWGWTFSDGDDKEASVSGNGAKEEDLKEFSSITVDADICDLNICVGNTYHIACKSKNTGEAEYQIDGGQLLVTQRNPKRFDGGISTASRSCKVTITIPAGTELDGVNLDVAVGDIDVSGITAKQLDVTANVGEVDLEDAQLGDVVIDADVGDVNIEHCTFGNMNVEAAVGSIEIESPVSLADYTFDLSADIGQVEINGQNRKRKVKQDGSGPCLLKLKANVGEIEIEYP